MFSSTPLRAPRMALLAIGAAVAALLTATATPADAARNFDTVCPDPATVDYDDRDEISAAHIEAVRCLTELGIVQGYGSGAGVVYLPDAEVTRAQMATFVVNMLSEAGVDLPAPSDQGFVDVEDDDVHATSIRQLAEIGVVEGVSADRYAGHRFVTRAQMASYLIRAQAYEAGVEDDDLQGGETPFTDLAPNGVHVPSIEGAYELDITDGQSETQYDPDGTVARGPMASFIARTLDAMVTRQTVADRDGGALAHTVFTFLSEGGRCFQVTAGEAWAAQCDPAPAEEPLKVYTVQVGNAFTVVAGVVTTNVTRVVVETEGGQTVDVDELVDTRSPNLLAWASPRLLDSVQAIVAYDDGEQVARISPDDPQEEVPFDANMQPDVNEQISGEPVNVTDIRVGQHETYDRVVLDLAGDGLPAWRAEYVEQAFAQGSGTEIALEGSAVLQVLLRDNLEFPPGDDRLATETRVDGFTTGVLNEVYFGTLFEGQTQVFLGLDQQVPFRVFALDDPPRIVIDVVHPGAAG